MCEKKWIDLYTMEENELTELIKNNFHKNLSRILKMKGITLKQLAKDVHISKKSAWNYTNTFVCPKITTLLKISVYLNVSIIELILPPSLVQNQYSDTKTQLLLQTIKQMEEIIKND